MSGLPTSASINCREITSAVLHMSECEAMREQLHMTTHSFHIGLGASVLYCHPETVSKGQVFSF